MDWQLAATIVVPLTAVIGYSVKSLNIRLKAIERELGQLRERISVIETILISMGWPGGFARTGTDKDG
jgi:hypothetical protein